MDEKQIQIKTSFIYDLLSATHNDDLNYVYHGYFNTNITDSILALAERNMKTIAESSLIKKKVYHIVVECLQNITRYQEKKPDSDQDKGFFLIQKHGAYFYITSGNLISRNKKQELYQRLEKINSMSQDELKAYYKKILSQGDFTENGGAGLGLINMARKSGFPLNYDFQDINDKFSYFYFQTVISNKQKQEKRVTQPYSIHNAQKLHFDLQKAKVSLLFNNVFSQDKLISLLSMIENKTKDLDCRKKVFNILVEMLQNLISHGESLGSTKGIPGVFYIFELEKKYALNTGNYIRNDKIDQLKQQIEQVNSLEQKELNKYYESKLMNNDSWQAEKIGLGFIDIRTKSGYKMNYFITAVDNLYSFFTLRVFVEKN